MACPAESKPIPSSFDKYGGMYAGKIKGNGKIDRFQGWSRFNATTLNDTRVGSFSSGKEDNHNFNTLYNLREEDHPVTTTRTTTQTRILTKSRSTNKDAATARRAPIVNESAIPRSNLKVSSIPEDAPKVEKVDVISSTPRIRHTRSASFAPPYGGYSAKPSAAASNSPPSVVRSPPAETTARQSPEVAPEIANLRRQASEPAGRFVHRRGSSDMAALRGAAADFFSSDKLEPEISSSRRSLHGNESPKDSEKMKGSPMKENGSTSSRSSSVAGSPTVARTSSAENLFANGASPPSSSGGSLHSRSASCNVGNLLGAATSGAYSGGGLNSGNISHFSFQPSNYTLISLLMSG